MQVWSAQSGCNVRLHGWLLNDSEYDSGAAVTGRDGVNPPGTSQDFNAVFYSRSGCGVADTRYHLDPIAAGLMMG